MSSYDLHCHSTYSDGVLPPRDLVLRAAARGVDVLALTDHDQLAGLEEARDAARECGVRVIDGCELSVSWGNDHTLHVVALRIDPRSPSLVEGLERIRTGRSTRARRIARSLAEAGIGGAYEGALKYVTHEDLVSRTHFARYLVDAGYVREVKDVFERFLSPGKPGYVAHEWASLPDAIRWIREAGGQAVLAHPARYRVGTAGMRRLLGEFRDQGGDAIEVISSSHTASDTVEYATLARVFGLKASAGSDFHSPDESSLDLGGLPPLPVGTVPVWQDW